MYNRENPSEDYKYLVKEYQELHSVGRDGISGKKHFNGISLAFHFLPLTNIIFKEGAKSLLDYGCGKALLYDKEKYKTLHLDKKGKTLPKPLHEMWQLDYHALYDPGYDKYNKLPKGKYDAVICTDVIEHIDKKDVDWILEEIFSYARRFVFVTIACYEALKTFKDGRNVHVNIQTPEHWDKKLNKLHEKYSHLNIHYSLDIIEDKDAVKPISVSEYKIIERK